MRLGVKLPGPFYLSTRLGRGHRRRGSAGPLLSALVWLFLLPIYVGAAVVLLTVYLVARVVRWSIARHRTRQSATLNTPDPTA